MIFGNTGQLFTLAVSYVGWCPRIHPAIVSLRLCFLGLASHSREALKMLVSVARWNQGKKRCSRVSDEHFEPDFNTAWSSEVFF